VGRLGVLGLRPFARYQLAPRVTRWHCQPTNRPTDYTELEASNRSLQAEVKALQQDQAEVEQLLADYRAEQAAHSSLQAEHTALQVG
jgi:uncharacterized protein YlxW (UPF0749 family)